MADLLNMGTTGLLAYQRALQTTSQNITNVNTDGYSRQRVDLATLPPQFTGAGYQGSGVTINGIKRVYDEFLATQLTSSISLYKTQDTIFNFSKQIDNFLGDPQTGMMPALQNFFNSVQDVANDPSSTPVRQVMLGESQSLVARFDATYDQLKAMEQAVNVELNTAISEVNSLSTAIARINKDILFAQGGTSQPPNDLLDQRQQLVNELAEYVNVSTVQQGDGTLNVFVGNGQSLVVGTQAEQLAITRNQYDTTRFEVGLIIGNTTVEVSDQMTGGRIGGALTFRESTLDPAYAAVGRVAVVMGTEINRQHNLGIDLDGDLGGNYFNDLTSNLAVSSQNNAATTDTVFSSTVTNVNLLQDSDYQMTYTTAGGYSLLRLSDNQVVASAATVGALSTAVSASEGFSIALNSGSTISDGDRFLFRPVSLGARDIAMNVTQTNDIAAAGTLRTGVDTTAPLNTGNAVIGSGEFTVRTGNTLPTNNTTLSFDTANNRFDVTFADGSTATLAYNPATDSGNTLSLGILDDTGAAFGTFTFTMTGTPANGDGFVISPNATGVSDNRNALLLQSLQQKKIIDKGATTFQDSYGEMVAEIGVKTKQADFAAEANRALNERAFAAHQEVSGVNLDEEAADLIRFQQAYQAVAQIISTADQLFQTLLGVVGR